MGCSGRCPARNPELHRHGNGSLRPDGDVLAVHQPGVADRDRRDQNKMRNPVHESLYGTVLTATLIRPHTFDDDGRGQCRGDDGVVSSRGVGRQTARFPDRRAGTTALRLAPIGHPRRHAAAGVAHNPDANGRAGDIGLRPFARRDELRVPILRCAAFRWIAVANDVPSTAWRCRIVAASTICGLHSPPSDCCCCCRLEPLKTGSIPLACSAHSRQAWAGRSNIVYGQKAGRAHGAAASTWGLIVAACLTVPIGIADAGRALLAPWIWTFGMAVAVFSSALPYTLEMVALRRLSAKTFGTLMCFSRRLPPLPVSPSCMST